MRKLLAFVAIVLSAASIVGSASVQAADLAVRLDTVIVSGVPAGQRIELAVVSAGPNAGKECSVRAIHGGRGAAHPGNDLFVSSGGREVALRDVERVSGAVTDTANVILLVDVIIVDLRMGADAAFDGDIVLEFDCLSEQGIAESTLPITGRETTVTLLLGIVLVLSGIALLNAARRPTRDVSPMGRP